MTRWTGVLAALLAWGVAGPAVGQTATYGENGLEIRTPGDGFSATIGFRNQVRFTTPFVEVPDAASDITSTSLRDLRLNRSRFKAEGQALSPRLSYKFQADFVEERVRDFNVTWAHRDWLNVRAGWWKIEYLVERMQSSGSQQLVDRSILDRWFTLGRQRGVQVHGQVGTRARVGRYYVGAFRNMDAPGGTALPLWLARYEWAWQGRHPELEQGDADASRELQLQVGASVVRAESAFAFFGGSGVGAALSVPGLPDDEEASGFSPDRYQTRHAGGDLVLKWRGVSLQGEAHRKHLRLTRTGVERTVVGGYVMAGVLASTLWERAPKPLELTARLAIVDPAREVADNDQQEAVVGASWYFSGHRSRLGVDVTHLRYSTPTGARSADLRTRAQWEFTF